VEPLGGIEVKSNTPPYENLSQPQKLGEGVELAQDESIVNKDGDNKEIEMTKFTTPAVANTQEGALPSGRLVQAPPATAAAAIPNRGTNKDTSYNKPTKASNARLNSTDGTVDFASSLRKMPGGNTRRRNHKTRRSNTLKNKKQ
jgi:hypothetical protein